ncbi:amino acid ABC transporter substrate-binding protein [Marinobacterium aestuarii]|uniref:Amino acid ABC transporter substrate-binding protein n=1 Tax=Marinobacterium aestuarii TaxID=1821621 RepID=A0A1A9EZA3_9GAMM|nr:transporter substrate-binding domain-containing protein [Marinobacterium aestuarii]ANG63235.1 amino acid ABC transporter substrate-binding protein [Marinobacterium aestuarii]
MWSNRLNAFVLGCVCLLALPAQAREYDDVIASGYVRIGLYRNFSPYSYLDKGVPAGVDVEIGKRIAKGLGVRFEPHWIVPDENLEDDLRNNVWKGHYLDKNDDQPLALKRLADVMMRVPYDREYSYMRDSTGVVVNEQVVMFGPYQSERWQLAYDSEKISRVSTMAVFQYHSIGVELDSLPSFYLTSGFQGRMREHTHHFPSLPLAFAAMQRGEVDAVMGMRAEIDQQLSLAGSDRYRLGENGFPGMGKQSWDLGMAIKHSNRQLGYAVEEVVDGLIRSGEMAGIYSGLGLQYELPAFYRDTAN